MEKYFCKRAGTSEEYVKVEGCTPEDAAQNYAVTLPESYAKHQIFDNARACRVLFYIIHVSRVSPISEAYEPFIVRVFSHGIFRKGGVPIYTYQKRLKKIADDLGLEVDTLLAGEGEEWEGEETLEEAEERISKQRGEL